MRTLLRRYGLALVFFVLSFSATAWVGQTAPPLRTPIPGPTAEPSTLQELHVLNGRGESEARAVVDKAPELLPFDPSVPTLVPPGYRLHLADVSVRSSSSASFTLVYLGEAGAHEQLHVYQKAGPLLKETIAPIVAQEDLVIRDAVWRYVLISFPQPTGQPLIVHAISRFDGERYTSIDWRSQGQVDAERAMLASIAASLR